MITKFSQTTMDSSLRVYALGGLDEPGKNLYCIETNDSIFIIEAGLKYPDLSNPGIDIIIPDTTFLKERANKVRAIIISHAHDDEYGALPYLLKNVNVPVYCTQTTKNFIMADYGKRYGNLMKFNIIKPSDDVLIHGYPFHFFGTSHTVMESFGFSMETPVGCIVYTGDYISDFGVQGHFTFDIAKITKIAEQHPTLLMMSESDGADKPGIVSPTHKISPHIKSFFEEGDKRIIIACYTQNMYIINEIIQLVIQNNKKIAITNENFLNILPSFIANGDLVIPMANQCPIEQINSVPKENLVILITGSGEELYNYIGDVAKGEAKDQHFYIDKDDIFVMACPSVPSTEVKQVETLDALYQTGANIVNLTKKDLSSMHAQEEDLKMMISIFRPTYYMPIEGPFRLMMANAKIAQGLGYPPERIFLVDNGTAVAFDAVGRPMLPFTQILNPGNIFIDGLGVGDVRSNIIDERTQMSSSGVVVLSALISSKNHLIKVKPKIEIKGVVSPNQIEELQTAILRLFNTYLNELVSSPILYIDVVMKKAIKAIGDEIFRQTNKRPIIIPSIIDVDNPTPIDVKLETESK